MVVTRVCMCVRIWLYTTCYTVQLYHCGSTDIHIVVLSSIIRQLKRGLQTFLEGTTNE